MASSSTVATSSALVVRRLYRSLLRTTKPFTAPSENAVVLTCLLHRTGIDDNVSDWDGVVTANATAAATATAVSNSSKTQDQARDLTLSYKESPTGIHGGSQRQSYPRLFRRLLREVIAGPDGVQKMLFPRQVNPNRLRDVVRREFRDGEHNVSSLFDISTRRKVAFVALRELNKKLSYFDVLQENAPKPLPHQAAWHVSQLPFQMPSVYLKPGTFLVSNPHMNDSFFSRTVICILEHVDDDASENAGNTYGLIVNRVSVNSGTGKNRTLREAFKENHLPARLADVFGDSVVKEGGPVHASLQMLYSATADNDELTSIGGSVIPTLPEGDISPALYSDRATYFQGDIFKAMDAVDKGIIDRDDISFFVGASSWSPGQLESEIAQGFWIPTRAPAEIALTGICEHDPSVPSKSKRPLADLWLSMMSACGEDEAKLAHMVYHEEWDENALPCDLFDDEF